MPEEVADGGRKLVTLDDLIDALDKRERAPSNVPKVETFHFKGDRVSDWLDLTEQALVGLSDEVKLQRVLRYVLHNHHREVTKVVDAAGGSWAKFGDLMRRKYRLGDGLLTMADLEAMNKEDFSTIGAFLHEFKKRARKVHGIFEEAQCATFLGLLTGSEATELTKYGEGSERLTWATIDKGVEEGNLDQVEQHQMRLQRLKRKERDATASGTPGVKRIVKDVLASLGKEVIEVQEEEDEGDDEEDERLRHEEDWRAEQRAKKRGAQGGAEPSLHDGMPKRKKYAVRLEEGFDVERMVDKLLECHNDLMNLKDILASVPRLRGELKGRLSRSLVPDVHLSFILPREIEWTEAGTRMDWKCVACGLVDLKVRDQPSIAMVDAGAEMNIIRERDATMLGLEVDQSDHGVLHGANCKAIFCGTASNVMVEIGRVGARTCFFVMPDVDHPILLGRSFLCRMETLVFNRHEGTMILALSDPACENYEIIKCRNTGPRSARNRLNLGSFTFEESEYARRRLREEQEGEGAGEVLSLSLNDVNKAMEVVAAHDMSDPEAIKALREQKRTLMVETMRRRHCAYAFNDDERGRLDVDKIPMIRIHTVPHEPWNLRGARYPNPDEVKKVVDYLDGKMRTYVADYSSGPYASPWFCFIKPNGTLRWVQDLQRLNAMMVRDAGGLPNADALSESCARRPIISLIDLYSGYDQFPVYPLDRPVTAMHTPRGLIHMNVAPQGWTNAVAMVQRHMIRVMQTVSPHVTQPYIDDLVVKGPKEKEEDEVMPGVRRFVWKHVQDIDQVLGLLEEHNLTASDPKSKHCMREATILGFVCNEKGRRPDVKKTDKILESFVKNFATKTEHLRKLVRQDQEWVWGEDQEKVVEGMKREFKEGGLVLGAPNYEATGKKPFVVETDAGPTALGGVLIQADADGKERPLRFESRTLNTTERNYSQFKKETLAVLHCLRTFRNYIFGRRLILRVDPTALACSLKSYTPSDPTIARWLTYIWMLNFELERIPGDKNRADGLSRINWDGGNQESIEDTPPVDGFLDQEEDIRLHINKWSLRVPSCVTHPIWLAPRGYAKKEELVLKSFQEEDPWGSRDVGWMMRLVLAGTHGLVEEVRTIEEGPTQVEEHEQLMGGMYLLTNTLLQGNFDQRSAVSSEEGELLIPESQDDEFEEGEIREVFRAEEYDGINRELGLLLSCEMRDRDASAKAQKMRHLYVVRDGHLFIKRQVGNPKRIVCGRNRQIDVIAALHDGIAGGHKGVSVTCAKISELYHWDGMLTMVIKHCQSCVPCQQRSAQRPGEPLHPRLEREVGAVVHLNLLFIPLGEDGSNYIFDTRDNLTGFVDDRAIRTKTGPVLARCIEEYYLRYPFVREFVMDRGSEFTCNEVRTLLAGYGVVANYTTAAHPQANAPVERGHSTITNLLAKWTEGKPNQWPKFLRAAFFVENVTVKRTTKSDFSKAVMQRGGRDTRPRQGPQRMEGRGEQHEPPRREPTPEFDNDNIELFLDVYRDHEAQRVWSVAERIHHFRGIGRFEEPVAQICEEVLTWPDVEAGMQRLRTSPRGRDGMPIRLEEGNADEFIPAYEHYMLSLGVAQEEWVRALLIWTRQVERQVAKQIWERARDWEDCQAQLRRAYGRPQHERREPRVERRRRSKRPREPAPREAGLARETRGAPAQREDEPAGPALAAELFPACGLRAVEFRRITSEELRPPSPLPSTQELDIPRETPFRSLATHLDVSQWEASRLGEGSVEPACYVRLEEPLDPEMETDMRDREEPQDPEMAAERPDPIRPQGTEAITIGDDTPPCSPAPEPAQRSWPEAIPEPRSEEIPELSPDVTTMPEQKAEAEDQGVCERARMEAPLDLPSATQVTKSPDIEEPVLAELPPVVSCASEGMEEEALTPGGQGPRVEGTPRETREEKSARVRVRLGEIHAGQAEMEAARIEPTPPVEPKTSEQRIDELWARYESQRDATRQRSREAGRADEETSELREMGDLGFSATRQAIERMDRRVCETAVTSFQWYNLLSNELRIKELEVEHLTTQLVEERARSQAREVEWERRFGEMTTAVDRLSVAWEASQIGRAGADGEGRGMRASPSQGAAVEVPRQSEPMEEVPLEAVEEEGGAQESLMTISTERRGSRLHELATAMGIGTPQKRPQKLDAPEQAPRLGELRAELGSWATETDSEGPTRGSSSSRRS
ncbi:hypothetical protein CBR_g53676 [Chara braunii]|uniref:RNA-directed DNA polymerase n=1 Tax=Chara braunii TaxID=69332 RepID=A0A388MB33_CHABU|nr:hypothetical protein CBR_g53676 [Chara braunii]|eukprot:GBG91787.1 hypothetical protein CBR_g53676 [Chara braunii]